MGWGIDCPHCGVRCKSMERYNWHVIKCRKPDDPWYMLLLGASNAGYWDAEAEARAILEGE